MAAEADARCKERTVRLANGSIDDRVSNLPAPRWLSLTRGNSLYMLIS
jgi:hypothetical protein